MANGDQGIESAFQRTNEFERQLRRVRWAVAVLAVGLVAALLLPSIIIRHSVIETMGFAIKDAKGTVRGRLQVLEADTLLDLYDAAGRVQAELNSSPHGPTLVLYGSDGKLRGTLTTSADGTNLSLYAAGIDEPQMTVSVGHRNSMLELRDVNGRERVMLKSGERTEGQPDASVVLTDREGNILFKAP